MLAVPPPLQGQAPRNGGAVDRASAALSALADAPGPIAPAGALDALALGEAQAESLGIHVGRIRLTVLFGVALGVGAATAVSGAIGFVGLVAPHLVRPLVGHRPSATLIPATLAGAIVVVLADIATRIVRIGPTINLGVFISIAGAPFFLWLVLHVGRRTP